MLLCPSCEVLRELRERFQSYFPPWCNADGRFPSRFAERIKWDDVWCKSSWPNRNLPDGHKTLSSSSSSLTSYQRWENMFVFIATQGCHMQRNDFLITHSTQHLSPGWNFHLWCSRIIFCDLSPWKAIPCPLLVPPYFQPNILFQILKSCFISWPLGWEFLKKREKLVHLSTCSYTQHSVYGVH